MACPVDLLGPLSLGFWQRHRKGSVPDDSEGIESTCNAGDTGDVGSISGSGGFPGRNGNLLQYSSLKNPMDKGAWLATVHGITKSQTWLCSKDMGGCVHKEMRPLVMRGSICLGVQWPLLRPGLPFKAETSPIGCGTQSPGGVRLGRVLSETHFYKCQLSFCSSEKKIHWGLEFMWINYLCNFRFINHFKHCPSLFLTFALFILSLYHIAFYEPTWLSAFSLYVTSSFNVRE